MGNYAAHKRPEIRDWLSDNPRVHPRFTPTSASWMDLVEVWFGIIERQAIRRGSYCGVRELNAKIRALINGWNDRAHPFVWTKSAEEMLAKADRQTTSATGPLELGRLDEACNDWARMLDDYPSVQSGRCDDRLNTMMGTLRPEPHPPAARAQGEHGPPEPALPATPHQLPNPLTPANLPVHPPANLQAALSRLSAGKQLSDIERALAGLDHIDTTAFTPSTPASTLAQVHTPSTPATTHPTLVTSAAHPPTGDLNQALRLSEDELAAFGTRNPGQIRASADTPHTQPHPDTRPTRHDFTPPTGTDTPPDIPSRNETPHDETQPHNPTQDLSPDIGTVHTNTPYAPPPPLHRDIPLAERKQLRSKYESEDDLYNP
jgi:hypothetical protein